MPEPARRVDLYNLLTTWQNEADFSDNHPFLADWLTNPDALAVEIGRLYQKEVKRTTPA